MELSQPPPDEETKNIIDRLANFVARNGSEFEAMTKQKQRDNPRFQFLFGGEYYNYYTYRVTTEQAILKHQAMRQQQQMQTGGGQYPVNAASSQMDMEHQQNFQSGSVQGQQPQDPRFGQPQQQPDFERHFGSGSNYHTTVDRDRPGFERPGSGHPNFDRGPSSNDSLGTNYDRHTPNFERCPENPGPNFERSGSGFERGMPPGQFDRGGVGGGPRHFMTGQGTPGLRFARQPGPGPRFDQGGSGPTGHFERSVGPPGVVHFDRPTGPQHFERHQGPSGTMYQPDRPNNPPTGQTFKPGFDRSSAGTGRPFHLDSPGPVPVLGLVPQPPPVPVVSQTIEALTAQKTLLEEQVRQSEKNLLAQHQVLLAQQQAQIEEALKRVQDTEIQTLADELGINIQEFDSVLQPIMESCTKESISTGKAWIFTHTSTKRHYNLMTSYLLRKTTDPSLKYLERLHLIYLVNDVLHHCMRKGANDLQQALEMVVIPMFCFAKVLEANSEENLGKLNKLFSLWESKSNYVTNEALEKLRNFNQTWIDYKADLVARHAVMVAQIANIIQQTYEGYQGQHQIFVQHAGQNIKNMEQQIIRVQQQQAQQQAQQQMEAQLQMQRQQQLMQQQQQIPVMRNQFIPGTGPGPHGGYSGPGSNIGPSLSPGPQHTGPSYIPPPGVTPQNSDTQIPDLSRPPPGFPPPSDRDLMPGLPYFELPAGLMVTLVKLEDDNYKPIDPKVIRLPPPCPPTERLLQAVDAYYGPPSHERPRDSEGWERLGLYEYFKAKNLARKKKDDDIREGRREKSRSPTPIRRESSPNGRSPPRKRYQSKSPPQSKRRRSRSRSPSRRSSRRSRRSRSRSLSRRSPTPPLFTSAGLGMENKLDESNKGHQLLKKMGWGGTGLGANEQGIEAPIQGGELRERKDQYKGVGISVNDPFECYRKSKGQAFVERMRQRAEDRV